ncbi:hypothetical protein KP509_31G016800 [Ceratopteris richardii]|uniref:Uncharacterized protein n=1 Tax=Ceratopteris richardii TaxID=49495 RepID=A0A8T2QXP7_CERRI|nr:hypothetical protein KP509_31G016800 [Ceratopteris richardii]
MVVEPGSVMDGVYTLRLLTNASVCEGVIQLHKPDLKIDQPLGDDLCTVLYMHERLSNLLLNIFCFPSLQFRGTPQHFYRIISVNKRVVADQFSPSYRNMMAKEGRILQVVLNLSHEEFHALKY